MAFCEAGAVVRVSSKSHRRNTMTKMKAAVFVEPRRIVLEDKAVPDIGPLDALIKITTTTIW